MHDVVAAMDEAAALPESIKRGDRKIGVLLVRKYGEHERAAGAQGGSGGHECRAEIAKVDEGRGAGHDVIALRACEHERYQVGLVKLVVDVLGLGPLEHGRRQIDADL